MAVSANETSDDRTLLRRYRQEAADLRNQLSALLAAQNAGGAPLSLQQFQTLHALHDLGEGEGGAGGEVRGGGGAGAVCPAVGGGGWLAPRIFHGEVAQASACGAHTDCVVEAAHASA